MTNDDNQTTENDEGHELTGKQQAFIDHWFACFNAKEAARRAGYSAESEHSLEVEGYRTLRNAEVWAEIQRRWSAHGASAQELVNWLAELRRFNPSVLLDADGNLDPVQVKANARFIRRFEYNRFGKLVKVEVHDPLRAAELMGKSFGMFRETVDLVVHDLDPDG